MYLIKAALFLGFASMAGLFLFFACANKSIAREFRNKLMMVLAYCILVSFFSPTPLICNLLAFLTVPLFARKRTEIAPIYVFSFLILPGVGMPLTIGGTWLMAIDNIMSVTAGAALMATIKGGGGGQRSWTVPGVCLLAIFSVYVLSGIRATTPTNMLRVLVEQLCTFVLPFYAVRRSIRTGDDVRRIFIGMVAATTALSTLAIYEAWTTWPLYRVIYNHYGITLGSGASVKMRGGLLRSPGPFPEPTSFAYWLSIGTFIAMTSSWMFRSKIKFWGMCAVLLLGMYAPQSRGAWLGLIVAYLVYQVGTGQVSKMLKGVVVAALFGGLVYGAALTIPQVAQTLGLDTTGVVKRDYRQDLWTRGIEEAQHNLLIGTDIGTVMTSLADMKQGEGIVDFVNTYLYVLLVSGLIGVTAFGSGLLVPIAVLWKRAKMLRRYDTRQLSVIAALLGSIAVMLAFTSLVGRSTMGLGVMLGMAAALSKMRPANLMTQKKPSRRAKNLGANDATPQVDPVPAMTG
ncbi:O-antigen ligase family protein [Sphingomonas mollis]|uniref:O-antigen ligase family protein n=1 Tax=Sphingomonas mollis TaxID=2795726 RepID=A0ABS0XPA2_9SPHN|nr:O-antigen ligase family protein [Sphingomonas sp. BT553]MBJ6121620.1 O-antigen ligase family protein [Sphingomonas sp. BT553]